MGFFYQAIKKATGMADQLEQELPLEAPARERMTGEDNGASAVSRVEVAAAEASSSRAAATAVALRASLQPKNHFEVAHPLPNLVAFLTPPVLDPNIAAMEQCRVIRSRLKEIVNNKRIRSLMMTSALPNEGKTLMSVNLAYAMSQIENMNVLLVDADMRRPSVAPFLKMHVNKGLETYLNSSDSLQDVVWRITPSLHVVPAGEVLENSSELLHSVRMQQFLAEATAAYRLVIFDAPPLFPIVDAQVLGQMVDAAVLVVRANSTPYDLARQGADLLKSKLIGSILNCVERNQGNSYYGSYYGGYMYQDKDKKKSRKK